MFSQNWIFTLLWFAYQIQASEAAPDASELSLDIGSCFIDSNFQGFLVTYPLQCTCRKTDPELEGQVHWAFANGTKAPQTVEASSSVLVLQGPMLYERTHTFTCNIVSSAGATISTVEYPVNFVFGPVSAQLRRADDSSSGVHYVCPGETIVEKVYCEVPLDTVNPYPKFQLYVNGVRYITGYDAVGGVPIEESNVVRLEWPISLNTTGAYSVLCKVWNYYRFSIQAQATLAVFLSEKANCP